MTLAFSSIAVDTLRCVASISGVAVKMAPSEAVILNALVEARGEVVSYRELLNVMYRDPSREPASDRNAVLAFVSHLRFRLAKAGFHNVVVTKFGCGYFFDVHADQTRPNLKRQNNTPLQHLPETVALVRQMWMACASEKAISTAARISVDQISRMRMRLRFPSRADVMAAIAERNKPAPGRLDHGPMPLPSGHPYALAILREAGLPI